MAEIVALKRGLWEKESGICGILCNELDEEGMWVRQGMKDESYCSAQVKAD